MAAGDEGMEKGIIFDIEHGSFVNGPGIRTAVYMKGCNLRCLWCHNPESRQQSPQLMFYAEKCTGCGKCLGACENRQKDCVQCGKCAEACPHDARVLSGRAYTVSEVLEEIEKDMPFYQFSGGGATFSGGECLLQPEFLYALLQGCGARGISTAVDTAGCVSWNVIEKILPLTDLFLYDVKCFSASVHKRYTGADNRLILSNLKKLLQLKKRVWIRIPVIGGVNDSVEEMRKIRDFLRDSGGAERVELLPYHDMGRNKCNALGIDFHPFSVPEEDKLRELQAVFSPE